MNLLFADIVITDIINTTEVPQMEIFILAFIIVAAMATVDIPEQCECARVRHD
jgi:hypothetical protein